MLLFVRRYDVRVLLGWLDNCYEKLDSLSFLVLSM